MKILHTSDWHLGRTLHGFSLIEDQAYMLSELLKVIKEEKIDILIIAGDIYDKSIPNEEAVKLFNQFLSDVVLEEKVCTIAIAGNHDSNERIDFGSELFRSQELYIVGKAVKGYENIRIKRNEEEVDFYLIPYIEPAKVRELSRDETIRRHDEAMAYLCSEIEKEKREVPSIVVAHAFVTGGEVSDSERRLSVVGGAELVDASRFEAFTYTALGHLHKRQSMKGDKIRYSGSPLKYSISEAGYSKGYVLLELNGNEVNVEERPLKSLRDVRILKGSVDEIITASEYDQSRGDYVYARLRGDVVEDATAILRQIYPYILGCEWINASKEDEEEMVREENRSFLQTKERSISEVFMEFLDFLGEIDFEEEEKGYIESLLKEIEEGKDET